MFLANYIMVGIVILVLVTFSILILCGKGDSLIAGYNTAKIDLSGEYAIGRAAFFEKNFEFAGRVFDKAGQMDSGPVMDIFPLIFHVPFELSRNLCIFGCTLPRSIWQRQATCSSRRATRPVRKTSHG